MTLVETLQQKGIKRVGTAQRGFRWVGARKADEARLHELKIPPAWTEVAVSPSASTRLQAVGKDKAGRWQYRYSDQAVRERETRKYDRLMAFAKAIAGLQKPIERDLSLPGLPREKVMACLMRILSTCFLRPGSEVYAKENGSFGIVTLQNRHVQVQGDTVRFDYNGKSGQRQQRELKDRRVARTIRELKALPGKEVFQYLAEDGQRVKVSRQALNGYIKAAMGDRFSARDFRTWAGTMICANVLARMKTEMTPGRTDRRRLLTAAVKETALRLGNTPAVCKSSYIWPSVLSSFYVGHVLDPHFKSVDELIACTTRRRAQCEKALLVLLKEGRSAEPVALAKKRARRGSEGQRAAQTKLSKKMKAPALRKLAKVFLAS